MNNNWQSQFRADAGLFPHLLDLPNDQVLVSHLNEEAFRQASFLDQRVFIPEMKREFVPWEALSDIKLPDPLPPQYIFHIGHVGSTLISRLLGETDTVLALREPQILRDLCDISLILGEPECPWSPERFAKRLPETISWLSRSFRSEQRAMVKASSFVSELASRLLNDNDKALFLFVPLHRYLPTILAGDGSIQETHMLAGTRLQRLTKRIGVAPANLWELSLTQRVALSWVCEMCTLVETYKDLKTSNILWMNFDTFLQCPSQKLATAADHFNHHLSSEKVNELISGPIMSVYSKAPEHDYSGKLRQELLDEASKKYADDIRSAMLWVDELAANHAPIGEIMQLAETLG